MVCRRKDFTQLNIIFSTRDNPGIFLRAGKYKGYVQMSISFSEGIIGKDLCDVGWATKKMKFKTPLLEKPLEILGDYYAVRSDRINAPLFCKNMRGKIQPSNTKCNLVLLKQR